jgi:cytochrome c oxidase subunit 1
MAIAVPTGVKIFNWIGTIWGGHLKMRTPMMFALGFIWLFMLGGFSGVMHAAAPADAQQHNSYFVVAHFHYVLIGGSLFALLAGIHYWFPLMFGRKVSEFWGKLSFWIIFWGFNITFFPMHFLGLDGMPRRTFTYDANMGWNEGNQIATVGAFILGVGIAIYFIVMVYTFYRGEQVGRDPWDARTLEWSLPIPIPEYNYRVIPTIHARDAFWYDKHHAEEAEKEHSAGLKADASHGGIHMPFQSIYPLVAATGILIGSIGVAVIDPAPAWVVIGPKLGLSLFGLVIFLIGVYLWAIEGNDGYHVHPEGEDHHS